MAIVCKLWLIMYHESRKLWLIMYHESRFFLSIYMCSINYLVCILIFIIAFILLSTITASELVAIYTHTSVCVNTKPLLNYIGYDT